jgi:hypothetical protein
VKTFWVKTSIILNSLKICPNFFLQHFKHKIIFNFVKFVTTKKYDKIFFHPSLFLLCLDPGSEIWDPGWVKIRIRDKHPGSATLINQLTYCTEGGADPVNLVQSESGNQVGPDSSKKNQLYCTSGVLFFIDYCTDLRDT